MKQWAGFLFVSLLASVVLSQPEPRERVGPLPNGGFLLNSGWRLEPAGKQIPLDTLPLSSALSRDGKYLLVLNGGYNPPSITVIDTGSAAVLGSTPVEDGWLGLTFSAAGDRVYAGGGSRAAVFEFAFSGGKLQPARTFPVIPTNQRTGRDFVGDVAFSPDGRLLYAADMFHDSVAVINPQSGIVIQRYKTGRRPYRILFHPDGKSFFVTHWTDGSLGQYDTASGSQMGLLRLGAHPTDMVWRAGGPAEPEEGEAPYVARLFVAAANTNTVYSVAVSASRELKLNEAINVSMTPQQPLGMTPSALALSTDAKRLYVACSDANAVAVADVSGDRTRVEGFIPTGWYPTAVRALASGTLVVLNGKGVGSYPNPNGPNPTKAGKDSTQFVARMQKGTASWIDSFSDTQLASWSKTVLANSPYTDAKLDEPNPLPSIEHVVYIVKENRTYDQVLGDVKEGNGDPSLVLFGENITPNHHKLAREFVLFDNFYVNADISPDGHHWSTAAIANDYVAKLWPNNAARRRTEYDFEGQEPTAAPPAGYLWTNAAMAGLSLRNFGYWVENRPNAPVGAEQIMKVYDPVLNRVTNRFFRGYDQGFPDVERGKVFATELADYEKNGSMPRLIVMRLGNDHTSGTTPGAIAPLSSAADNDAALGNIVEAVSHSRFWSSSAIFVVEDDAQNGPDHVDSHRSLAFVISPFVKHHLVDSTMYNTASVLRTMELLLGLRPMTHFDAGARIMSASFQANADTTPYTAEKPRIRLDERNPGNAPGARASARMDFREADLNDDDELNDILWRAIRHQSPPPPTRSYFAR
ncbi:MAG: bifunctional YncE family protein/alkaline phosphatase family protein [Acidobacteriia bacterium]|nr:bifunctional YncE family protein/alkaline phosphatase family protein [Terriglobia bacterium]